MISQPVRYPAHPGPETAVAEDYLALALAMAREPARLDACKARLQCNRLTMPLFDVAAYTRALEDLYRAMWKRRCAGKAPAAIWATAPGVISQF